MGRPPPQASVGNWLRTSALRGVYERLPEAVKGSYRRARHAPSRWRYRNSPAGAAHSRRLLGAWRDRFHGHRAVLMGNGPSLRSSDWTALSREFTIGTNRIYLLRDEMGFDPSAYCCVNHLVLRQFHQEIAEVKAVKVIGWREGRRVLSADRATAFLPESPFHRFHYSLIDEGWNAGFTVTFAAMQLAFYLGFSRLILIGVDHRFEAEGPPMRETTSRQPDRDHFSPEYFGPGIRWHLPNLAGSEASYELAREAYRQSGREIVDATEHGALEVFPKTSLQEGLADARIPPPPPHLLATWQEALRRRR